MYQLPLNFEQILTLVKQLPEEDKLRLNQILKKDNQNIIKKWQYLIEHHQELDELNPLSNSEIDTICQYLAEHNQTRPLIQSEQKIGITDNFNDSLPDDILKSFYE
ncbi:hypothetical protein [Gloeocapsa sp. PCC 73106]|uniref:hypothetical protein n=1 Tax=Gloeocapsa sp. PCC 73106 TaxID=102232 RepID=UPI0002ACB475|nr:hypothetical protein [Gloeocapsa sp. PCC 73106]ELR98291.1 hypothetical protein GLO73106DRAFT_00021190 [Gloeocapsa sp. PCC 73106]